MAHLRNADRVAAPDSFNCTYADDYTFVPRNGQQGGQRKLLCCRVRIDRRPGADNVKANAEITIPQTVRAACAHIIVIWCHRFLHFPALVPLKRERAQLDKVAFQRGRAGECDK